MCPTPWAVEEPDNPSASRPFPRVSPAPGGLYVAVVSHPRRGAVRRRSPAGGSEDQTSLAEGQNRGKGPDSRSGARRARRAEAGVASGDGQEFVQAQREVVEVGGERSRRVGAAYRR